MKKDKKNDKINRDLVVSDTNSRDHSNDPFIVSKVERSIKLIEKYGLPKEIMDRRK